MQFFSFRYNDVDCLKETLRGDRQPPVRNDLPDSPFSYARSLLEGYICGTSYYPGWKAWVGGNTIQIEIEKESGAMLLEIEEGEHLLELKFSDTSLSVFSKIISAMFSLILFSLATWKRGLARSSEG